MANPTMTTMKAVGIALIVLGAGLIVWGYQLSDSVQSELTETISGSMPDEVMYRYIGGAVSVVVGLFLALQR
jgi:hypothetical protein